MPFDLKKSIDDGWTHKDVVEHFAPTINYDSQAAIDDGWSYEEIADHLSKKTYPPFSDTSRALDKLSMPRISDSNNLTAMDRERVNQFLKAQPPEVAHATRTNAMIEMQKRQAGEISQNYPSFKRAISNIPKNIAEVVENFASLLVGIPYMIGRHVGEVYERGKEKEVLYKDGRVPTLQEVQNLDRPYSIGELASAVGKEFQEGWPYFKEDPLLHTGFWMEENPADTLLLGTGAWQIGGGVARLGLKGVGAATGKNLTKTTGRVPWEIGNIEVARPYSKNPLTKEFLQKPFDAGMKRYPNVKKYFEKRKGGKLVSKMRNRYEELNFNDRAKLHNEIFVELEKLSDAELKIAMPFLEGRLHFMDDLPGDIQGVVDLSKRAKTESIYRQGRPEGKWWTPDKGYAEGFGKKGSSIQEKELQGRVKIIDEEVLKKSMTPEELAKEEIVGYEAALDRLGYDGFKRLEESMAGDTSWSYYLKDVEKSTTPQWEHGGIPSKIGRGSENINPQRVRDFESWYRGFQKEIEYGFKLDEKMTAGQLEDVIYKPIEIETGLSRAAIKEELGDFTPSYVHHFFPDKAKDKMGVHFADTTGKRYKPDALKKRKGVVGYSEDMTEVLPRLASSYVKWKNTQAYLKEFEETFATVVNYKDIKKGGLEPGQKIVAPDSILRFYKGEVDAWKEIAKRMDDTVDFDEAAVGMLQDLHAGVGDVKKPFLGVSGDTKVWIVPEEAYNKLNNMAQPFLNNQAIQDTLKLSFDPAQQVWKDSVLALSPRWIKNNVVGDIIFSLFDGVGPVSSFRAMQSYGAKYANVFPDEILTASFANLMKHTPLLGKTEKTAVGRWFKKAGETVPAKLYKKITSAGYSINTAIEQPFVRALYIKLAREEAKTMLKAEKLARTPENIMTKLAQIKDTPALKDPIVAKVKETLPVFNNLGYYGRMYGRRAIPFLNWYKFMSVYAAKLPAKHPFKLAGVRGLSDLSEKERERAFIQYFPYMEDKIAKEGGINRRFSGLWPIGKDEKTGEGIFFNARGLNPFRTVSDILEGNFVNMMSPIIKVHAERAFGVESYSGQKFTTPYPLDVSPEGEVSEVQKPKPNLFTHYARQFPLFTMLEQTLTPAQQYSTGTVFNPKPIRDPITGEPKYPINALEKMLNYSGIDKKTLDVEKWFHTNEARIRAKGALTHKNMMFDPNALTLDEHRAIFETMQEDEKLMDRLRKAVKGRIEYEQRTKVERLKKIKNGSEK